MYQVPNEYVFHSMHGGAYRSALNRNTEMRYRIVDFGVILFFTEWAQNGVHGVKIGRIGAKFRCASLLFQTKTIWGKN